jgi:hypothetical protein
MARGGRTRMIAGGTMGRIGICPDNYYWSPRLYRCVEQDMSQKRGGRVRRRMRRGGQAKRKYIYGGRQDVTGQCPSGTRWNPAGYCEPIPRASMAFGGRSDIIGQCARGERWNPAGYCEPIPRASMARGGRTRGMKHGGVTTSNSTSNVQTSGYTGGGELWCTTHTSTAGCGSGGEDGSYAGDYYSKNGRIYGGLEVHDGSVQIRPTPLLSNQNKK